MKRSSLLDFVRRLENRQSLGTVKMQTHPILKLPFFDPQPPFESVWYVLACSHGGKRRIAGTPAAAKG